jgi:hypothetical protein
MKYFIFLFIFSIQFLSLQIESQSACPTKEDGFFYITIFKVKDLSKDIYSLTMKARKVGDISSSDRMKQLLFVDEKRSLFDFPETEKLPISYRTESEEYIKINHLDQKSLKIKIRDIETEELTSLYPVNGSIQYKTLYGQFISNTSMELVPSKMVTAGKKCIELYWQNEETLLDSFYYEFPDRNAGMGAQPVLLKEQAISPKGGTQGDTLTIRGRNLGDNLDNIAIYLLSDEIIPDYEFQEKELAEIFPLTLSQPDEKKVQEIKFTIPNDVFVKEKPTLFEKIVGKPLHLRVMVNKRPSPLEKIVILDKNWKIYTGILSILTTLLFLALIGLALRKLNFFSDIILDKRTNKYSLSRLQSFAWTLTLFGSYFFVAISHIVVLGSGTIPDFNYSLIGLLVISYTGLGVSLQIDKNISNDVKSKPDWRDLFSSSSEGLDLTKIQLFGFTVIAIALYIFNMFQGNVMNGLPDIPATLHALLGTSQGGYLTGKWGGFHKTQDVIQTEPISGEEDADKDEIEMVDMAEDDMPTKK